MKIRADVGKIEYKKIIEKNNGTKCLFFEKNKIDKIYLDASRIKQKSQIKLEMKKRYYNGHRNIKDHKKTLWAIICQQIGKPYRNV